MKVTQKTDRSTIDSIAMHCSTGITTNQLDDEGSGEGSGEGSADGILDVPDEADLDDDRRALKFAGRKESAG